MELPAWSTGASAVAGAVIAWVGKDTIKAVLGAHVVQPWLQRRGKLRLVDEHLTPVEIRADDILRPGSRLWAFWLIARVKLRLFNSAKVPRHLYSLLFEVGFSGSNDPDVDKAAAPYEAPDWLGLREPMLAPDGSVISASIAPESMGEAVGDIRIFCRGIIFDGDFRLTPSADLHAPSRLWVRLLCNDTSKKKRHDLVLDVDGFERQGFIRFWGDVETLARQEYRKRGLLPLPKPGA